MPPWKSYRDALILPKPHDLILRLPYDIIFLVFELVGLGNATCLGLTCRLFYKHLKAYHRSPISLDEHCCDCDQGRQCNKFTRNPYPGDLGWALASSNFARGYRLWWERSHPTRLLNEQIYGESCYIEYDPLIRQPAEERLSSRYEDWNISKVETAPHHDTENDLEIGERRLPSPFNLGDEWIIKALEAVRQDFRKNRYNHNRQWKGYWREFHFAKENWEAILEIMDEETWEMCTDGLSLLGL